MQTFLEAAGPGGVRGVEPRPARSPGALGRDAGWAPLLWLGLETAREPDNEHQAGGGGSRDLQKKITFAFCYMMGNYSCKDRFQKAWIPNNP